jgi:molybdate-binding protein
MFRTYLNPKEHKVVSFVTRQQGLILQSSNPKNVHGLADLTRTDIKFINRQKDSGTRSLLDELIKIEQIEANQIQGFTDEEYTHSAVAAFIAAGMADVGLGIEAAAQHFGLDFLPIAVEHYLMVCKTNTLEQPAVKNLLGVMQSEEFIQRVNTLPGYTPNQCGKILNIEDLLDWIESY